MAVAAAVVAQAQNVLHAAEEENDLEDNEDHDDNDDDEDNEDSVHSNSSEDSDEDVTNNIDAEAGSDLSLD